jgi:hypothetical protein
VGEFVPHFTKSGGHTWWWQVAEWSALTSTPCFPCSCDARPFCHSGRKMWRNAPFPLPGLPSSPLPRPTLRRRQRNDRCAACEGWRPCLPALCLAGYAEASSYGQRGDAGGVVVLGVVDVRADRVRGHRLHGIGAQQRLRLGVLRCLRVEPAVKGRRRQDDGLALVHRPGGTGLPEPRGAVPVKRPHMPLGGVQQQVRSPAFRRGSPRLKAGLRTPKLFLDAALVYYRRQGIP